ncbi:hypothetical protein [Rufibacter psychrotolerans]|uniref:hypothetical protein n=1 Tax=Rufibacter psychrotolerans TaxID=2812556 RepID=UPI00196873E6|nr:hypothetical protein [Rufibacter sp. SYSU D00308]
MKIILLPILLLFLLVNAYSQNITKIDSKRSFRDFEFGKPIKNFKGLKQLSVKGCRVCIYETVGAVKPLGEDRINEIEVGTIDGLVSHIIVTVNGDFNKYYRIFNEEYGNPVKTNNYVNGLLPFAYTMVTTPYDMWKGKRTQIYLIDRKCKVNSDSKDCVMILYNDLKKRDKVIDKIKSEI